MIYNCDVSNCRVSEFVKEVTICRIDDASNSDTLSILSFEGTGWQIVDKKGNHKVNDRVIFVPPETVFPVEMTEEMGITKYTKGGRIRAIKLRKNYSFGIILSKELYEKYKEFILHWNPPVNEQLYGEQEKPSLVSPYFIKMPEVINIKNFNPFKEGEKLIYSEKIHGTNARWGIMKNPYLDTYELTIGSHNVVFKNNEINQSNLYIKTVNELLKTSLNDYNIIGYINNNNILKEFKNFPNNFVFFGEIYGHGVQELTYGLEKTDIKIFGIFNIKTMLPYYDVTNICQISNIPCVKFHKVIYESIEQLEQLATQPSEYTDKHIREGIVVQKEDDPNVLIKVINPEYYL